MYGNDGKIREIYKPVLSSYKGCCDSNAEHNIRLTMFNNNGNNRFKGYWKDDEETYYIDPVEEYVAVGVGLSLIIIVVAVCSQ